TTRTSRNPKAQETNGSATLKANAAPRSPAVILNQRGAPALAATAAPTGASRHHAATLMFPPSRVSTGSNVAELTCYPGVAITAAVTCTIDYRATTKHNT